MDRSAFSLLFAYWVYQVSFSKNRSIFNLLRLKKTPFQVAYFYDHKISEQIQQFAQECDATILYCHLIRMAEYGRKLNIKYKILDYMDAFSKGMERIKNQGVWWMRIPAYFEWKRLVKYEHEVFNLFQHKIIISEQDRDLIPMPKTFSNTSNSEWRWFWLFQTQRNREEIRFAFQWKYVLCTKYCKYDLHRRRTFARN